jgi:hypothetical protein
MFFDFSCPLRVRIWHRAFVVVRVGYGWATRPNNGEIFEIFV